MNRIPIFLFFLALFSSSVATHTGEPWLLETESHEKNIIDGSFEIPVKVRALDSVHWNHHLVVLPDGMQPWFNGFFIQGGQNPPGPMHPQDSVVTTLIVNYAPHLRPYNFQKVKVGLQNNQTQTIEQWEYVYLYFTPYNTVEVWSLHDWEMLKRVWDSPNDIPQQRIFVEQNEVPVSDLTDEEYAADSVPIEYAHVPGLAYSVPMHALPEGQKVNANTFTGTITGRIMATVNDNSGGTQDIPVMGIRVRLMHKRSGNYNKKIEDGFTDENGNFSIPYTYSKSGNNLDIFVKVIAETEDKSIRVRTRLGAIRKENFFKNNTYSHHHNDVGNHDFGTMKPDNNNVKAQLLHWAVRSKELVDSEVTGFSLPTTKSNRLEFMISFSGSSNAMFMPGGAQAQLIALVASLGGYTPNPILQALKGATIATIKLLSSNKDCIYMGSQTELNENTAYHEFGHYLMWHLQNESWGEVFEASFASHSTQANVKNPILAWNEGFAHGFSAIADAWAAKDDGEYGVIFKGNASASYESREIAGNLPEASVWGIDSNGTVSSNDQAVTHGAVSEWSIGSAIYDLWDGDNNLQLNGNAAPAPGDYNDSGDDMLEISFQEIVDVLLANQGTGGFVGQAQYLINDIVDYHNELMQLSDCDLKIQATDIMHLNGIRNLDDDLGSNTLPEHLFADLLNTDSIYFRRTVEWDHFKPITDPNAEWKYKSTKNKAWNFDVTRLPDFNSDYNFTPAIDASGILSDDLVVDGTGGVADSKLMFNANQVNGWQTSINAYGITAGTTTPPPNNFVVSLCGGMNLEAIHGGTIQVGDGNAHTSEVYLEAGGTLTLGGGKWSPSTETDTLYGDPVSKGKLIINDNSSLTIERDATLQIERGAEIHLAGPNSILYINGDLHIADSALFTFYGQGMIYFNLPDNRGFPNVFMGRKSRVRFVGADTTDQTFYIEESTKFSTSWPEDSIWVTIENCRGEIGGDGYMDVSSAEFTMRDAKITSTPIGFRGIRLNGYESTIENVEFKNGKPALWYQPKRPTGPLDQVVTQATFTGGGIFVDSLFTLEVDSSTFDNFQYGIEAFQTDLTLNHCDFTNGDIGLLTHEGSATLTECELSYLNTGWQCNSPTGNVQVNGGIVENNTDFGYDFLGGGVSIEMDTTESSNNGTGIKVLGPFTLSPQCSKFNANYNYGIQLTAGSVLDMDNYTYNEVKGNNKNVFMIDAGLPQLDYGNNDFTHLTSQWSMYGTILNQPCNCITWEVDPYTYVLTCTEYAMVDDMILATQNTWNMSSSAPGVFDYQLTDNTGNCDYTLVDGSGGASYSCASPLKMAPQSTADAHLFATGRILQSGAYQGQPFGAAVEAALRLPAGAQGLSTWHALLTQDLSAPDPSEQKLLRKSYAALQNSFATLAGQKAVNFQRQANLTAVDPYARQVLDVIEAQLAAGNQNSDEVFLAQLRADRARLYSQLGLTEIALDLYAKELQVMTGDRSAHLAQMACQTEAKQRLQRGSIGLEEFFEQVIACASLKYDAADGSELEAALDGSPVVQLFPNPAQDRVQIQVQGVEGAWEAAVYNVNGLRVKQLRAPAGSNSPVALSLDGLADGLYLVRVDAGKQVVTQRLIVQH